MPPRVPNKDTLAFYRRLLHTMMEVFHGDFNTFHRIRIEARQKILENKDLTDELEIQEKIFFGEEARDFLTSNVIQANLQDNGHYRLKIRKDHGLGSTVKDQIIDAPTDAQKISQ